jgi:hypothetical protein
VLQPGEDRLRRQHLDPRRRQLDGQRQAIQPAGDLRDRRCVLLAEGESQYRGGCPLGEQPHRLAGRDGISRRRLRVRDRERRDRAFLLAGNAQRRTAADQHSQGTRLAQQPRHERGTGQQVLEVVQNDQQVPLAQLVDQVLHQGPVPGVLQPDALGDCRWHQPRIPHRRQRNEVHPVGIVSGYLRGKRDAQPCLAAATRPGQGDQETALEQPSRLRKLAFPADEAGERPGQPDAAGIGPHGVRLIALHGRALAPPAGSGGRR